MLNNKHLSELLASGIDPEIAQLNFKSLDGDAPLQYLLYGLPLKERRNDGRLREKWIKRYAHTYKGGWWCAGIDLIEGGESLWGQFKPDRPRKIHQQEKRLKYEAPPKTPTELFALRVSFRIAELIAERNQIALEGIIKDQNSGEALEFWTWVAENPQIEIAITEGAKKAASLLSVGICAIALPGIFSGYRQPKDENGKPVGTAYLIPQLNKLAANGRKISFFYDNDSKPETKRNVRIAICKTGRLLKIKGCDVRIVDWEGIDNPKGVDDLITQKGLDYLETKITQAQNLGFYEMKNLFDLSPMANESINQKFLDVPWIDPSAQLIGIQSAKGTGKTRLIEILAREAQQKGQRILVVTHRIQLAKALCDRLGIDHLDDFRLSETKGALGLGLCIDSLHEKSKIRFKANEWGGALIVLDEIEQLLWHLLNSSTCQTNRLQLLQNFQLLLKSATAAGGKIICSDADLAPISIDFIDKLIGHPLQKHIIINSYKPIEGKRNLSIYKSPQALLAKIEDGLLRGQNLFLCVSAQKSRSKWSAQNIERQFKGLLRDEEILRIDAQSIADPTHPAYGCISNINQIVGQYRLIIASPTIETGVSIDLRNHFDGVYAIFSGIHTIDSASQALARVRADIPRHVYAANRSFAFIGRGETNFKKLLRTQHQQTKANISLLIQSGLAEIDQDFLDFGIQQNALSYWAKKAVFYNFGFWDYKKKLLDKLEKEGYKIVSPTNPDPDSDRRINTEITTIRDKTYEAERIAISEAEDLSEHEIKQLDKRRQLSAEQRNQLRKANLRKLYGVEVSPELILKDDDRWFVKLQLHYYLTIGRDFLKYREQKKFDALLQHFEDKEGRRGTIFKPDACRKLIYLKIRALELLRIDQLLILDKEYSAASLTEWKKHILRYRYEIKELFGIKISEERSTIECANALLGIIGLRLTYQGRLGSRNNRTTVYKFAVSDPDGRAEVFAYWESRDLKAYRTPTQCQASV